MDDQRPVRILYFEILERAGRGGMGEVYKARDVRLGRLVALKFLSPGTEASEEARLRFLLEARAISALDHPNVCTLYEIGETDDGRMFLAMAYVEGGTLRDRLARGPIEPLEAALLAAQVADGLRLASFLAPDPIPAEMFESDEMVVHQAVSLLSNEAGQEEASRKVRDALAELRSLSLISGYGEFLSMHRLMQEVVRNHAPEDRQLSWIELTLALLAQYAPYQSDDANNWPIWDVLRPHVTQALELAGWRSAAQESRAATTLMTGLGVLLVAKSLYSEAEKPTPGPREPCRSWQLLFESRVVVPKPNQSHDKPWRSSRASSARIIPRLNPPGMTWTHSRQRR